MEYTVVRSKRKTLCMQIKRDGSIVVRAPFGVKEEEIQKFVLRHGDWAEKKLSERTPPPAFQDGERIQIEGISYVITTGRAAAIKKGTLFLPSEGREEALIALLKRRTRIRMEALLDEICKQYGFTYTGLTITSARGRWGSCNAKKHISFPFRTEFLPDALARYVAVHELCHTLEMNHSAAFWRQVERILPNYNLLRKQLHAYRWALVCL